MYITLQKWKKRESEDYLKCMLTIEKRLKSFYAGEIGAVVGLKYTITGDTLASEKDPVILERMEFRTSYFVAVEPKLKLTKKKKNGYCVRKISRRRSIIQSKYWWRNWTNYYFRNGELHLEILVDRMKENLKLKLKLVLLKLFIEKQLKCC